MKANIYFVGAGGIGMAALERYFLSKGRKVAGYDRTPSELTDALEKEGVEITFTDDVATIPDAFRDPAETDPRVEIAVFRRHPRQDYHLDNGRPHTPDPGDRQQRLPRRCGPQLWLKLPALAHQPILCRGGR